MDIIHKQTALGLGELKPSILNASEPLLHVFNLSLEMGVFPYQLNKLKSCLFKVDDPCLFFNYRPISILPCSSKLLEKLVDNCLLKQFNDNNILNAHHYVFREYHSPSVAVTQLFDSIIKTLEITVGVLVDLSKAFYTLNCDVVLLEKKYPYGLSGTDLLWFKSCLSARSNL